MKVALKFSEKIEILQDNTFLLCDEEGNEVLAMVVGEEKILTATANDIRKGTVAATDKGITEGEKVIPSYHTSEGYCLITNGQPFEIRNLEYLDLFDFTKLQVIICPYSKGIAGSVAAEKVCIDEKVYAVNSTEALSTVTKDSENKTINLGITNDSGSLYLIRYFMYKEIF